MCITSHTISTYFPHMQILDVSSFGVDFHTFHITTTITTNYYLLYIKKEATEVAPFFTFCSLTFASLSLCTLLSCT